MRTKIRVEQQHLKRGIRGHCEFCPVALAITEQTGLKALVGYSTIQIKEIEDVFYEGLKTPRSVAKFLNKYDFLEEEKVEPFNFFLVKK